MTRTEEVTETETGCWKLVRGEGLEWAELVVTGTPQTVAEIESSLCTWDRWKELQDGRGWLRNTHHSA